jgi:restriction system protein
MARRTLFAILSNSPWWVSLVIAVGLYAALRLFLPELGALFAGLPFVVVAGYSLWRQLRTPSIANVTNSLEALRGMSWEEFSALVEYAFRADGYTVEALAGGKADYELRKNSRVTIVRCRRWKVAREGVGPLRELVEARNSREADDCMYVSACDFTSNARAFAAGNGIRLLCDAELARSIGARRKKR